MALNIRANVFAFVLMLMLANVATAQDIAIPAGFEIIDETEVSYTLSDGTTSINVIIQNDTFVADDADGLILFDGAHVQDIDPAMLAGFFGGINIIVDAFTAGFAGMENPRSVANLPYQEGDWHVFIVDGAFTDGITLVRGASDDAPLVIIDTLEMPAGEYEAMLPVLLEFAQANY